MPEDEHNSFKNREELAKYIQEEIINNNWSIRNFTMFSAESKLVKRGVNIPIKNLPWDRLFFKEDIIRRKNQINNRKSER